MGKVIQFSGLSNRVRLANYLAVTYADCDLGSLPDTAPSGKPSKQMYLEEADEILRILGVSDD
jgi:hypothetical protein